MLITRELLEQGRRCGGNWTRAQLQALGVPWPLETGWQRRLIGTQASPEAVQAFLAGKRAPRKPRCHQRGDRHPEPAYTGAQQAALVLVAEAMRAQG